MIDSAPNSAIRDVFDAITNVAVQGYRQDGTAFYWNRASEELYGYLADEAIGKTFDALLSPVVVLPDGREVAQLDANDLGAGPTTFRCKAKGGRMVFVHSTIHQDTLDGEPIWYCIDVDVTEQRTAQAERQALQEQYDIIASATMDVILIHAPDGTIEYVSPSVVRADGYLPEELLGADAYTLLHPDDRRRIHEEVMPRIEAGEDAVYTDVRIRHRSGRYEWKEIATQVRRDGTGRVLHFVCNARYIGDRKRMEQQLERLNLELEQRVQQRTLDLEATNDELASFSYSVAHDLRAPLRAMSGFSSILLEDEADQLSPEGREYLHRIHDGALQMSQMIDALLQMSRLTQDASRTEHLNLTEMARTVAAEVADRHRDRRVSFVAQEGVTGYGDWASVRLALTNLIDNAFKFVSKAQEPRVEFGCERQGNETVFFVRDNGAGFDPRYSSKLFQPFERLHRKSEYPGFGVGLATVSRIVRRHGGRIWADGSPDEGATFYFTLPSPATVSEPGERRGRRTGTR